MFCCIYQFAIQAKTNTYQHKDCTPDCEYYKDGKCSLLSIKTKKLDNDKFGSILVRTIKFPDAYRAFGNFHVLSASLIIHPINADIWIARVQKQDGKIVYKIIHNDGSGARDAQDLDDLNKKLKKWVKDDLVDLDFELCN